MACVDSDASKSGYTKLQSIKNGLGIPVHLTFSNEDFIAFRELGSDTSFSDQCEFIKKALLAPSNPTISSAGSSVTSRSEFNIYSNLNPNSRPDCVSKKVRLSSSNVIKVFPRTTTFGGLSSRLNVPSNISSDGLSSISSLPISLELVNKSSNERVLAPKTPTFSTTSNLFSFSIDSILSSSTRAFKNPHSYDYALSCLVSEIIEEVVKENSGEILSYHLNYLTYEKYINKINSIVCYYPSNMASNHFLSSSQVTSKFVSDTQRMFRKDQDLTRNVALNPRPRKK